MDTNIKKAKPYKPDEMMFDGPLDKGRLLATLEQKYHELEQKRKKSDKES